MNEDVDSNKREIEFPNQVIVSLARLFLPEIQAYYSSDEGKTVFDALETKQKS